MQNDLSVVRKVLLSMLMHQIYLHGDYVIAQGNQSFCCQTWDHDLRRYIYVDFIYTKCSQFATLNMVYFGAEILKTVLVLRFSQCFN